MRTGCVGSNMYDPSRKRSPSLTSGLSEAPPPPLRAATALALIEDAIGSLRGERTPRAKVCVSRLLLLYPVGHPARPALLAAVAVLANEIDAEGKGR